MQGLNDGIGKLEKFTAALESLAKDFPSMQREFHEEVSQMMRQTVSAQINSKLKGSEGKAKGTHGGAAKIVNWQGEHVGSGGGYAAYRPNKGTGQTTKNGAYSIGHITNAIESGHKPPRPGLRGMSANYVYRPRFKTKSGRVPGQFFYKDSFSQIEDDAENKAMQLVEEIKKRLEV